MEVTYQGTHGLPWYGKKTASGNPGLKSGFKIIIKVKDV